MMFSKFRSFDKDFEIKNFLNDCNYMRFDRDKCNDDSFRKSQNFRIYCILKSWELYASDFEKLNDICEGGYYFNNEYSEKIKQTLEQVKTEKQKYKICSFSDTQKIESNDKQHLMWAHYANGHKGLRIDFELKDTKPHKVKYDNKNKVAVDLNNFDFHKFAMEIFTNKKSVWGYENEYRAIINVDFIPIEIKQIVIGRGFLQTTFNYERNGREFDNDLIGLAKWIRESLEEKDTDNSVKIFAYESKYGNRKIEIEV